MDEGTERATRGKGTEIDYDDPAEEERREARGGKGVVTRNESICLDTFPLLHPGTARPSAP